MKRRTFLGASAAAVAVAAFNSLPVEASARREPNCIVILCDDLGFGDVGSTGGKTIATHNIDWMVREGKQAVSQGIGWSHRRLHLLPAPRGIGTPRPTLPPHR